MTHVCPKLNLYTDTTAMNRQRHNLHCLIPLYIYFLFYVDIKIWNKLNNTLKPSPVSDIVCVHFFKIEIPNCVYSGGNELEEENEDRVGFLSQRQILYFRDIITVWIQWTIKLLLQLSSQQSIWVKNKVFLDCNYIL